MEQRTKLEGKDDAVKLMLLLQEWILDLKRLLTSATSYTYRSPDNMEDAICRTCITDYVGGESFPEVFAGYKALTNEIESPDYNSLRSRLDASCSFICQICIKVSLHSSLQRVTLDFRKPVLLIVRKQDFGSSRCKDPFRPSR